VAAKALHESAMFTVSGARKAGFLRHKSMPPQRSGRADANSRKPFRFREVRDARNS
jgi:hypothetical protein